MSQNRIQGHVRVRVTVEVPVGTWGGENSINDIAKGAKLEGVQTVRSALSKVSGARILGEPEFLCVIAEEGKE